MIRACRLTLLLLLLPFCAVPAAAQSDQPERHAGWVHAAIAASIVASSADLSTTSWAMGRGGGQFREANPLMRPFAGDPVALAVVKMGVATGVSYTLLRLHKRKPKTVLVLALAQTAVSGYIAHRNARQLGLR